MENYIFLFSPGNNSYVPQLAKYCNDVVIECNQKNVHIINKNCKSIITKNYECVKYAEIVTTFDNNLSKSLANMFCKIKDYMTDTTSDDMLYGINPVKFNLGQELDLYQINEAYQKILLKDKNAKIICFGVSRGGAALINFLALFKPTNIKGVIIEGAPSSLMEIVNNSSGLNYIFYSMINKLAPYVTNYRSNGPHPINSVLNLPHDIPILFVTSKKDQIVPYECSVNMYNKMIDNGYKNVELLVLENSKHDDYLSNNNDDTNKYLQSVSDIYKKILSNVN